MNISILTLFPSVLDPYLSTSILFRAQKKGKVHINLIDIRDFATDKHKSVDDSPYGGGPGMVMRIDVLDKAISFAKEKTHVSSPGAQKVILLDPAGETYTQEKAQTLRQLEHLILVSGHYEGFDNRILNFIDESISIGDYVLTGGELPALVVTDSIVRLLPGVLDKDEATKNETFKEKGFIEAPHYTYPSEYKGFAVPPILLSGNHKEIQKWRNEQSINRSKSQNKSIK